ncbi:hypothetical protein PILCRDRAFT_812567 [Piloderma croceum F 1598]|uniref:Uncharacterized protein n=1 Tax=Piloderma croceum (strain F 1598) TaxID=765440 RepID=A0A0C3G0M4_PILCF|nr:hypothetical protein PILCRDRAFT_812567 [Piloderma croceum F 1598]
MPSLCRLFHPSSPSVDDDLADLEECFRNSFALVPSALTPSRAPSNSLIAATRALFIDRVPKVPPQSKRSSSERIINTRITTSISSYPLQFLITQTSKVAQMTAINV